MAKKAQGISLNVIIIAAIALIVLVVLIAIFTGRLGVFVGGLSDANARAEQTALKFEYNTNCVPSISALQDQWEAAANSETDNGRLETSDEKAEYEDSKKTLAEGCKDIEEGDCSDECAWLTVA